MSFGGITALDDVSMAVQKGEVLGVIGPNGAGKTTLFNVICGFVDPDRGKLSWQGRSLAGIRPDQLAGLGIARTLQGVGLFANLSVLENVMVGAERFRQAHFFSAVLGLPGSDRDEGKLRQRARETLKRLGCDQIEDALPGTLPFAIQKRVALARALVSEPELLLLDEPAGGLSSADLPELRDLISALGEEIAVMLVEHHMDLVMSVCDRVAVLDFGSVIATGTPAEIKQNPDVVEAYLGRETAAEASDATHARG